MLSIAGLLITALAVSSNATASVQITSSSEERTAYKLQHGGARYLRQHRGFRHALSEPFMDKWFAHLTNDLKPDELMTFVENIDDTITKINPDHQSTDVYTRWTIYFNFNIIFNDYIVSRLHHVPSIISSINLSLKVDRRLEYYEKRKLESLTAIIKNRLKLAPTKYVKALLLKRHQEELQQQTLNLENEVKDSYTELVAQFFRYYTESVPMRSVNNYIDHNANALFNNLAHEFIRTMDRILSINEGVTRKSTIPELEVTISAERDLELFFEAIGFYVADYIYNNKEFSKLLGYRDSAKSMELSSLHTQHAFLFLHLIAMHAKNLLSQNSESSSTLSSIKALISGKSFNAKRRFNALLKAMISGVVKGLRINDAEAEKRIKKEILNPSAHICERILLQ